METFQTIDTEGRQFCGQPAQAPTCLTRQVLEMGRVNALTEQLFRP